MGEIFVMKPEPKSCMCSLCADYQIEKFAEVMACGCYCHSDGYTGHDSLCCSLPNVRPEHHLEQLKVKPVLPNRRAE